MKADCAEIDPAREAASLRFSGNTATIEMSPVVVALRQPNPVPVIMNWGGIWDITSGKADLATNGETQLLRYSIADPDLRILLTVAEDSYRVAARKSAGIHSIADLCGKRVTTPLDTTAHWCLLKLLRTANLRETDVVLVAIEPWQKQIEALAKGDVDAMVMWEPDPEVAREIIGDDIIFINGGKAGYRELFNLHASAKALVDPVKRTEIVKFVASIINASERLTLNPRESFPLISESSGIAENHIAAAWSDFSFPGKITGNLLDVLEEQEIWVADRQGRIPRSRSDLAGLIDENVYKDALSEARIG